MLDLNVLSLFDGISCGRQALEELKSKFTVKSYYSSEIEKSAIAIAKYRWPNNIHLGDVNKIEGHSLPNINLLFGGSPCFVSGTKIITDTEIKNIEDVNVGDKVLTHTQKFCRVLDIGNSNNYTVILKAQGIKPTETTSNHPYYVRTVLGRVWDNNSNSSKRKLSEPYWKEAGNLTKKDYIGMPIITAEENIHNLTEEECFIIGRYIADGHTRKDYRNSEGRSEDRYWQLILSVGENKLDSFSKNIKTLHYSAYKHTTSVYRVVFSNKRLVQIVEANCGSGAINKHISMNLLKLPKLLLKRLIEGYLSGDGHLKESVWNAPSISENLIMTLNLALLKVYNVNSSYEYRKNTPTAIIEGRLVNQHNSFITRFRLEMKKQSNPILIDNIMWLPVKSVTETNVIKTTYNMEVEYDNSYVANNAIVHNCKSFSFIGKQLNFDDPNGQLFFQFVRLLNETKPQYFLFENVNMKRVYQDVISEQLGVLPIRLNSLTLTGQRRDRLYWTNIPNISQPSQSGITLTSLLESGHSDRDKSLCILASYGSVRANDSGVNRYTNRSIGQLVKDTNNQWRKLSPIEVERLQGLPDDYTKFGIFTDKDNNYITKEVTKAHRYQAVGNGWSVPIIKHILEHIPT